MVHVGAGESRKRFRPTTNRNDRGDEGQGHCEGDDDMSIASSSLQVCGKDLLWGKNGTTG